MLDVSWWHVFFGTVIGGCGGFVLAAIMYAGSQADDLDEMIRRKTLEERARDWQ
jgi:hypothetical protein